MWDNQIPQNHKSHSSNVRDMENQCNKIPLKITNLTLMAFNEYELDEIRDIELQRIIIKIFKEIKETNKLLINNTDS